LVIKTEIQPILLLLIILIAVFFSGTSLCCECWCLFDNILW